MNGLGNALEKLGRMQQATVCYRKAISVDPTNLAALNNLGNALEELGSHDEAIACFRTALVHHPDSADVLSNLSRALRSNGELELAAQCCRKAIELRTDFASAYLNLSNVCKDLGLLQESASNYQKAIALKPKDALSYCNLADTLMEQGKVDEAIECLRKAMALGSDKNTAYSNLLMLYSSTHWLSPEAERECAEGWEQSLLTGKERSAARERASSRSGAFAALPRDGRKLRVGIVSAELGSHVVAIFLQPFLDELDRTRIHLSLFPTVARGGVRAEHFRAISDSYVSLVGVSDRDAAAYIRTQGIDILIDTTGHTSNCRLGIFAHRAAPVQCSYIGYWSTTGLTEMDWYITDEDYAGGCDSHFTEGLWKLPHVAHCYRGDESLPESAWIPDENGTIWLGSFNRYNKIRDESLGLWSKVLKALPQTKLLLEDRALYEAESHDRILAALRRNGIVESRVVFLPRVHGYDFAKHMALYDRLDIALDTIPFNSGTTAFDALWMGVPLVALQGNRICGRMAASIVKNLGYPQWAATSEDEYVSIISGLARNIEERIKLRKTLRASMIASPLCDGRGLARSLEDAFEAMYDRWLAAS